MKPEDELTLQLHQAALRAQAPAPDPNLRWNAIRIPVRYRGHVIGDVNVDEDSKSAARAFVDSFAQRWVPETTPTARYPENRDLIGHGLTLMGNPKTGKTRLACAILTEVASGHPQATVLFTPFADYIHFFNERHTWARSRDALSEANLNKIDASLSSVLEASLVVLDDIGREHMTASNAAVDELYRVLRSRERRGLVTIVTTSLTLDALKSAYDMHLSDFLVRSHTPVLVSVARRP